ncbi:MAG: hypothetical protein U9P44_00770, partial [archaeon]|nr:hypothetical protein [archaeon]
SSEGYAGYFAGGKGVKIIGDLAVGSKVKALQYCDENGENCKDASAGDSGGIGNSVMYLRGCMTLRSHSSINEVPAACPSGWVQADYKRATDGSGYNFVRTCFRTDLSCQVMYLRGCTTLNEVPAACPSGWDQADYKRATDGSGYNFVRTCYACS